jgi:hypothetical protein
MLHDPERTERNSAAYRRLKGTIDSTYPRGHFVAIDDGEIIGASADFWELYRATEAKGKDPRTVLVVQSGEELSEYSVILRVEPTR